MRNSEIMGYALYEAYCRLQGETPKDGWEAIYEDEQHVWVKMANIALSHLFEHGRIASYIGTPERLAELSKQYSAHLVAKNEAYSIDFFQPQSATVEATIADKRYKGIIYAIKEDGEQ
jgi:hypothetical protein